MDIRADIEKGITKLNLNLSDAQIDQLFNYLLQMEKWNRSYNLTSIRDIRQMVTRHILDSLVIAPYIKGDRCIDVGTGGGLPGIPMAICYPDKQWHLLDSNGKKTRFLTQMKAVLGLPHVDVVHSRAELYQPEQLFDGILSRAFATLVDMVTVTEHLLAENGRFLAMKAGGVNEEINALPEQFQVEEVISLLVPGLEDEQRHLVIMNRKGS